MSYFKTKKKPPTQETRKNEETPESKNDILLRIPECKVYLMKEGEAVKLAAGDFEVQRISDESLALDTAIKVGSDLQWPLTKDGPVVKQDAVNYLFSLPMGDGLQSFSYRVAFAEKSRGELGMLDEFLKENSLFTTTSASDSSLSSSSSSWSGKKKKAIDSVKGIFKCSNAYTNRVQKGAVEEKNTVAITEEKNTVTIVEKNQKSNDKKKGTTKSSKTKEKLSQKMVNVVESASDSVLKQAVKSKAGKAFLGSHAFNKMLDAAEAAGKQAMTATSGVITTAVTKRFGERAGETTGHVLASAGHCASAAWTSATGVLKAAAKFNMP